MKTPAANARAGANLFWAAVLIIAGAALAVLVNYVALGLSDELRGLAGLVGLVLMAWGAVQFLWHWRERVGRAAGLIGLIAGLLILIFSLMAQNLLGVIAGGFAAVIGAVLMLRK